MPLSDPAPREPIHKRVIEADGYQREDGLWDIEARLRDLKSYPFENAWRGTIEPGEPLHDMHMRLTIDDAFVIKTVEAATDRAPFSICDQALPNFQRLAGEKIGPGWNRLVRSKLGGVEGCTHMLTLLNAMGTVAFQTIYPKLSKQGSIADQQEPGRKPPLINTCYGFDSRREIVKDLWPDYYTGTDTNTQPDS